MTPQEAGRNAAKESLYHAIFRAKSNALEQRAIAIYNTYGFGYALGMNFKDRTRKRQMLWPEHLEQIQSNGVTKDGFSIK